MNIFTESVSGREVQMGHSPLLAATSDRSGETCLRIHPIDETRAAQLWMVVQTRPRKLRERVEHIRKTRRERERPSGSTNYQLLSYCNSRVNI